MSILIFPIFIAAYLFTRRSKPTPAKASQSLFVKYFATGLFFSLLTELFVTRDHVALFSQSVPTDLFLSIGIYGAMIIIWYWLVSHYVLPLFGVFASAGLWGIVFEQNFKILLSLNPVAYLYIFLVYGSLAAIPFAIFRHEFEARPHDSSPKKYIIAFLAQCIAYPAGFVWIAFFRLALNLK